MHQWYYVTENFQTLLSNLNPTEIQRSDIQTKIGSINSSLNSKYYPFEKPQMKAFVAGSHFKDLAIRPLSDVDLLYPLPSETILRLMKRVGNQPSQLLQEIKQTIQPTFPNTSINADGQVVVLNFQTVKFEVVPVLYLNGVVHYYDSSGGGETRTCNPLAEWQFINSHDQLYGGKARHLIKFAKAWKRENSVPLPTTALEVMACFFLARWEYNTRSMMWYDWMIRDFFEFALQYVGGNYRIAGTSESIELGSDWKGKAEKAYKNALDACYYERLNCKYLARDEWIKIFGSRFSSISVEQVFQSLYSKAA